MSYSKSSVKDTTGPNEDSLNDTLFPDFNTFPCEMAAKANSQQMSIVQKDWENREFVEVVQINVLKIANFLNQFDLTVRGKLSELNEKMNKLERAIEYCEAATKSSLEKQIADR